MKAVVMRAFGGPDALVVEAVPPPRPGPRQALVRVRACGVCRHDSLSRAGVLRRGMALPAILGHEVAGEVIELGANTAGLAVGDHVCSTQRAHVCGACTLCRTGHETLCARRLFLGHEVPGGYAELVVVDADNLVRIPDGMPFEHAAIAACAVGTTYNAVYDVAGVRAGERVVVTGAGGGLGIHAVQMARAAGAEVIGVTTSPGKVAAIRDAGAAHVVTTRDGAFSAAVREAAGGDGVDVAIDTVGAAVFQELRRSMAPLGRIVLVGEVGDGSVEVNLATLFRRGIRVDAAVSTSRHQLECTLRLLDAGTIRPAIHRTAPLEEACLAHIEMDRNQVVGRTVLVV